MYKGQGRLLGQARRWELQARPQGKPASHPHTVLPVCRDWRWVGLMGMDKRMHVTPITHSPEPSAYLGISTACVKTSLLLANERSHGSDQSRWTKQGQRAHPHQRTSPVLAPSSHLQIVVRQGIVDARLAV